MLSTYLKRPHTLERYRSGPAGPHLDPFTGWLEARGYQSDRIRRLLQGLQHFLRYPNGNHRHLFVGARHFVTFLEKTGRLSPSDPSPPASAEPQLFVAFRDWMA